MIRFATLLSGLMHITFVGGGVEEGSAFIFEFMHSATFYRSYSYLLNSDCRAEKCKCSFSV